MKREDMSPGKKAQHTAKWARTMTKWLITYSSRSGARWNLVEFGGRHGAESRGIVDLIAIRKDHRTDHPSLKRGDLLDIVIIQTKGGSSPRPKDQDVARLRKVAQHHSARTVLLAEWKQGNKPEFFVLVGSDWTPVRANEVFG